MIANRKIQLLILAGLILIAPAMAVLDTTNITTDITGALDIFWLVPQSVADNFGVLITLVMLGAVMMLIGVIIKWLKTMLENSIIKTQV